MKDLVQLSYLLILLQEICNGYDNSSYRIRAFFALLRCGFDAHLATRWKNKLHPTYDIIDMIERELLNASEKADPGESSVSG